MAKHGNKTKRKKTSKPRQRSALHKIRIKAKKFLRHDLGEHEKTLIEKIFTGDCCKGNLAINDSAPPNPKSEQTQANSIDGRLIQWICTDVAIRNLVNHRGIRLKKIFIRGTLDLDSCDIPFPLSFVECSFEQGVNLVDARTRTISFEKSWIPTLCAQGLIVAGTLEVTDCRVKTYVSLFSARISSTLNLSGSVLNWSALTNPRKKSKPESDAMRAGGLSVGGNLELSRGFVAFGAVRLTSATIDRNLYFQGAAFICAAALVARGASKIDDNDDQYCSILANRVAVKGGLQMEGGFFSLGMIRMINAEIGSDIDINNAILDTLIGRAFCGDGIEVQGATFIETTDLPGGQKNEGLGKLNAVIKTLPSNDSQNDLNKRLKFWNAERGTKVENGRTDRTLINGIVGFALANLQEGLYIRRVRFFNEFGMQSFCFMPEFFGTLEDAENDGPDKKENTIDHFVGVDLRYAEIGGKFEWKKISYAGNAKKYTRLNLHFAEVTLLASDVMGSGTLGSWPRRGNLNLEGFAYKGIDRLSEVGEIPVCKDLDDRKVKIKRCYHEYALLQWLKLHAPTEKIKESYRQGCSMGKIVWNEFSPQPYQQMAKILREAGHKRRAAQIIIERERKRRRRLLNLLPKNWNHNFFEIVASYFLDLTVGYGHLPRHAAYLMAALWLLGSYCLYAAHANGQVMPTRQGLKSNIEFSAPVFALGIVTPIVTFQQMENWTVVSTVGGRCDPDGCNIIRDTWWLPNLLFPPCEGRVSRNWVKFVTHGTQIFLIAGKFLGWILTTLFLASFTPIIRKD